MPDLPALLKRVEEAEGHDDDLNVELYALWGEGFPISKEIAIRRIVPDYTASLDASLALVKQLGAANAGRLVWLDNTPPSVTLSPPRIRSGLVHATGKTPALAVIAALLRAKMAEEEAYLRG